MQMELKTSLEGPKYQVNRKNKVSQSGQKLQAELIFQNRIGREWLSTEEAARYLSLSENALRIMVCRKQIIAHKLNSRLRFRVEDCAALIKMKGA